MSRLLQRLIGRATTGPGNGPGTGPTEAADEHARLTQALLKATAQLVAEQARHEAAEHVCQALAGASPHVLAVWAWFGPADPGRIVPHVLAGRWACRHGELAIHRNWITDRGPAYRVLRGERPGPYRLPEWAPRPAGPWAADGHRVRSMLCVPVPGVPGGPLGLLTIYASRADYFDPALSELLARAGELIGAFRRPTPLRGARPQALPERETAHA